MTKTRQYIFKKHPYRNKYNVVLLCDSQVHLLVALCSKIKHHDLWVAGFECTAWRKVNGEQLRQDQQKKRAQFQQSVSTGIYENLNSVYSTDHSQIVSKRYISYHCVWEHFLCHSSPTTDIDIVPIKFKPLVVGGFWFWSDWDEPETEQRVSMSLLFLLALYGSVNHEVGEVNVAFGFFRLQHTDWTTVSVKTNWWLQTTSWRRHLPFKNCSRLLLLFSAAMWWWHTVDLIKVIVPVNQTCRLRMSESESDGLLVTPSHSGNTVTLLGGFLQRQAGRETAVCMTHLLPSVPHTASVTQYVLNVMC